MRIIFLISQKGGSGKTTIAVHLAVCAEINTKRSAIIDCDPQGSALEWQSRRVSPTPKVIAATTERLPTLLKQARNNRAELIIVDTAPHSDKMTALAASVSDTILIPIRGGFADEAKKGLALPCVPVRLSQRVAYAHAINSGSSVEEYEPKGKASQEIRALYRWLTQRRV